MWQVGRALSGCRVGPKKRRMAQPKRCRPSCADWAAHLAQRGPDGGCRARVVDWELELDNAVCERPSPVMCFFEACRLAHEDLAGVKALATSIKLHKSAPPWGLPGEVWRQLLRPWSYRIRCKSGVGHRDEIPCLPVFVRCLFRLMVSIRLYGRTPLMWHRSRTHELDKNNGKSGCAAVRLINSLDVFGKLYYKWLWSNTHPMHSVRMQVDTPLGNRGFLPLYSKQHLPKDCGVQGGASVNRFMMLQMRSRHHHMSRWMTACAKERGHVTENCCDKDTFKLACTLRPLIKTFMCGRIPATYKATHMQVLSFLRCIIRVLTNGRMNAFPALETSWSQLTRSQVVRLTSPCPRMQTMWRGRCWHQVLSTCCRPSIAPTFRWTKRCRQYPLDRMLKKTRAFAILRWCWHK